VLLADPSLLARLALVTISIASAGAGVLVERWLFFAEAEHVAMLYYHGGTA
jgi:DMSO reductase anchor subunit